MGNVNLLLYIKRNFVQQMILFGEIIFGPLKSRRFGESLGINLLPLENKICNFDCIYCECGWTDLKSAKKYFFEKEKEIGRASCRERV